MKNALRRNAKNEKKNGNKTVAVIGLGYVGLPLALLADKKGYRVTGIDIDEKKIETLLKKELPFKEHSIKKDLEKNGIEFTGDWSAVSNVSIVVICVPTPVHHDYTPDIRPLQNACKMLGPHLKRRTLVILESTVNPGISENIIRPLLEKESGLTAGKDFHLAHCPERINPGDPQWNVENIPRVLGALTPAGSERAHAFYSSILTAPVKRMRSLKEAEAVKVVENSFRDINIAFVNELACSFSKLKIDVINVINGAATKPFAFMAHYPGCGVGGHCIPVDPYYLIQYAKQNGFRHKFLSLARSINNRMPRFTVELVEEILKENNQDIATSKIAVLGLAYKPNVSDDRESPSLHIIKELRERGARVEIFDPYLKEKSTVGNLEDAIRNASAVVVATAHRQFTTALTPGFLKKLNVGAVVDGRNCLSGKRFSRSGIVYRGIGVISS